MQERRLTARELRRLASLSRSRHRAVRTETLTPDLHLHKPAIHKQVVNHLFVMLFTSPHEESEIALEFWRAYRHLVESRPIAELRLSLINRDEFVAFFNAVKAAESDEDVDVTNSNNANEEERGAHEHDGDDEDGSFDEEE
jgi:hypothetical protein